MKRRITIDCDIKEESQEKFEQLLDSFMGLLREMERDYPESGRSNIELHVVKED